MVTQQEVLSFIAERTAAGRSVGVAQVVDQFWLLSPEAAAGHLWRLWRERLIDTLTPRRPRYRFRLEPGESITVLRFRLSPRGRHRLQWYAKATDDSPGLPFFR